jgi:hypothetical protein
MKRLSEDHKEIQSGKKLDDEGYMTQIELDKILQSVNKLKKVIKTSDHQIPAWVQSKITKASDYLDIAADYLSSDVEMDESISIEEFERNLARVRKEVQATLKAREERLKKQQPSQSPQPPQPSKPPQPPKPSKGPELPSFLKKEEISLVDKILAEMMGDKPGCDTKKPKKLNAIAKKHKVTIESLEKQLQKGIKVEMEHTTDRGEAETIALHHLDEIPDYYNRLNKMEKGAEINEETKSGDSNLRDWFKKSSGKDPKTGKEVPGWVQIGGPHAGAPCARQPGQKSTPKCGSSKMAADLSDKEEEKAFKRKNRKDPNQPEKTGSAKPTYVKTELEEKEGKKDACYNKVKSRYRVWPSAYGSGALVKCRKVGADNWGKTVDEATTRLPMQTGQILRVLINWRGKHLSVQMFFPQLGTPRRDEITYAVNKVYPEARVISYVPSELDSSTPIVQVREEKENKPLNKIIRTPGERKKSKVYVKNSKGDVVVVRFGDPNMEIKRDNPENLNNFRSRHNCDTATDKTTPRYWSCRQWRKGSKVED